MDRITARAQFAYAEAAIRPSESAAQLDLSPHTVRHHAENIFAKLGVEAPLDPRAVRVTA